MKRSLFASLFLVAMCAIASGSHATPAAAPASPAGVTAPKFGACRWYCNSGRSFTTLKACQAVCGAECEEIC
jgi:hypothetical protein